MDAEQLSEADQEADLSGVESKDVQHHGQGGQNQAQVCGGQH